MNDFLCSLTTRALKGTGFSPAMDNSTLQGALAPEGVVRA